MPPEPSSRLDVATDGTVSVPSFTLPLSASLSPQARAFLATALSSPRRMDMPHANDFGTEAEFRQTVDAFRVQLDAVMTGPAAGPTFPVTIEPANIAGVPVEIFTPPNGHDPDRLLINLHGGAFFSGAVHVGRIESIPLAYRGKFRVISVDYRQGYEHKFPAASEDVVAVYTELLKTHAPSQIGIYGGSAGGMLTAQVTAWLIEHDIPTPGAIGIFSAGTGGAGDGAYFSAIGTGKYPPDNIMSSIAGAKYGYFADTRPDDHLVNPNIAPDSFRARFPPALLITGTRAFDLSPALATHRALIRAGVDASLHVFDGHGHCFYYDAMMPESVDAYNTMIRFFRKHLSKD